MAEEMSLSTFGLSIGGSCNDNNNSNDINSIISCGKLTKKLLEHSLDITKMLQIWNCNIFCNIF